MSLQNNPSNKTDLKACTSSNAGKRKRQDDDADLQFVFFAPSKTCKKAKIETVTNNDQKRKRESSDVGVNKNKIFKTEHSSFKDDLKKADEVLHSLKNEKLFNQPNTEKSGGKDSTNTRPYTFQDIEGTNGETFYRVNKDGFAKKKMMFLAKRTLLTQNRIELMTKKKRTKEGNIIKKIEQGIVQIDSNISEIEQEIATLDKDSALEMLFRTGEPTTGLRYTFQEAYIETQKRNELDEIIRRRKEAEERGREVGEQMEKRQPIMNKEHNDAMEKGMQRKPTRPRKFGCKSTIRDELELGYKNKYRIRDDELKLFMNVFFGPFLSR
jgi:hypothetical protein